MSNAVIRRTPPGDRSSARGTTDHDAPPCERPRPRAPGLVRACAALVLACGAAATAAEAQRIGRVATPLAADTTVKLWTSNGNVVPVCWAMGGFDREKRIVRQAVADTWEYYSKVRFTGWDACPTSGPARHVRVGVTTQGAANGGSGGSAALGMNAMTGVGESPAVNVSFNADGTADSSRVEYVGVHEFGHVLGFIHEQDLPANVEGSAYCDQTEGVDPRGKAVTQYDGNSVMNYCNQDGNTRGRVTDLDITGVQAKYGARDHLAASVIQLHAGGEIWHHTGRPCTTDACPGWTLIDQNPRAIEIAAQPDEFGRAVLFARHANGDLWRWDGKSLCRAGACPGWMRIDMNPRTRGMAAAGPTVYQRHEDGSVWRWDGRTPCTATACPGWVRIDMNPRTKEIAAAGSVLLFQRHEDGKLWRWDGKTPCAGAACPGWALIDVNPRTRAIAAGGNTLYQRHEDGRVWRWDGTTTCSGAACPGWTLIDVNPRTRDIAAAGNTVFERHEDGSLWRWDGKTPCRAGACPGWTRIDMNARTMGMAPEPYGGVDGPPVLFQRHQDGKLWRWDGRTPCSATACPGWTLIDSNSRAIAIVPFLRVPMASRLSSGTR